jgi:carotenoid cleavage dioxygenase
MAGRFPYKWDASYPARIGVMPRDGANDDVQWFDIDPCYVFHVANAFETTSARGTVIALQAVRYPELWRDTGGLDTDGVLWSWTIDLQTGAVTERQLDDRAVEFPRIDDRLATLPARYTVSVGDGRLVRYDLTTGDAVEHVFGTAQSPGRPGEAVFVPSTSGQADESSGWYIGYVYDPVRDGSDLVIIDASDFAGQPVARIKLPQRVPYGFHGNWIAG